MSAISADHIAVSSATLPESPVLQRGRSDSAPRQSSSLPAPSPPAADIAVSISPEAREAAAQIGAATGHKAGSFAVTEKEKRADTAAPAGEPHARMADEKGRVEKQLREKIERQMEEEQKAEEEQMSKVAERRNREQEKAEKAEQEKESKKGNFFDATIENTRRSYINRQHINSAISGYQPKQSGNSKNVTSGASADSTEIFYRSSSSKRRTPLDLSA